MARAACTDRANGEHHYRRWLLRDKRRLVLSQDHGGTQEEREALVNAMNGLRVLRTDAACMVAAARSRRSGYTPRCKLGVRSRFEVGLISLRQLATIINQCCLSWAPFLQRSYK